LDRKRLKRSLEADGHSCCPGEITISVFSHLKSTQSVNNLLPRAIGCRGYGESTIHPAQQISEQSAAKVRFPPIVPMVVFASTVVESPQRGHLIYLIGRLFCILAENRNHPPH
jgi:hypothetical protein